MPFICLLSSAKRVRYDIHKAVMKIERIQFRSKFILQMVWIIFKADPNTWLNWDVFQCGFRINMKKKKSHVYSLVFYIVYCIHIRWMYPCSCAQIQVIHFSTNYRASKSNRIFLSWKKINWKLAFIVPFIHSISFLENFHEFSG